MWAIMMESDRVPGVEPKWAAAPGSFLTKPRLSLPTMRKFAGWPGSSSCALATRLLGGICTLCTLATDWSSYQLPVRMNAARITPPSTSAMTKRNAKARTENDVRCTVSRRVPAAPPPFRFHPLRKHRCSVVSPAVDVASLRRAAAVARAVAATGAPVAVTTDGAAVLVATDPVEVVTADGHAAWNALRHVDAAGFWVGWIAYDLGRTIEAFTSASGTPTQRFTSASGTPTQRFTSASGTPTQRFTSASGTPTQRFTSASGTPTQRVDAAAQDRVVPDLAFMRFESVTAFDRSGAHA